MLNVYCVYDTIGKNCICTFQSANDGVAVRENAPALSRVAPLGDLRLNLIGTLDEETLQITPCPPTVVSWDSYKYPETPLKPNPQSKPASQGVSASQISKLNAL